MQASRILNPVCRWWQAALLCAAFVAVAVSTSHAQVQLELSSKRRTFILYEPIVVTVKITNQAGRDLTFEDLPGKQWFNLEVETQDGEIIPPIDPNYHMPPLVVGAGQTVMRQIDVTPLFAIREPGQHRMRANVYVSATDRFYASNYIGFDLTDGRLIWRQDVGVPGSLDVRQVSLLSFQKPDRIDLYARIRDAEGQNVYTTQSIGRLVVNGREPEAMFDRQNTLHVLHEAQPNSYLYTLLSVDGERLNQQVYNRVGAAHPHLTRSADGTVEVHGGQIQVAAAQAVAGPATPVRTPKLSDRPASLPAKPKNPDDE